MVGTHFAYSLEICPLQGPEHLAVERGRHGGSERRPAQAREKRSGKERRPADADVTVVVWAQFNDPNKQRPNNANSPSHDPPPTQALTQASPFDTVPIRCLRFCSCIACRF